MTLSERRAAVRAALLADPTRSDRSIHEEIGCSRLVIARIRLDMIGRRLIENVPIRAADGKVRRYSRSPRPDHAGLTIERIRRLIDRIAGREFAATWNNTTPNTQDRLIDALDRLHRVVHNLKARVRRDRPAPGPRERAATTYRCPKELTA